MIVAFLDSCNDDLAWVRAHHESVFPAGADGAEVRFRGAILTLASASYAGRPTPEADHRLLPVKQTPFVFIYRVASDRIEILRVRDSRSRAGIPDGDE